MTAKNDAINKAITAARPTSAVAATRCPVATTRAGSKVKPPDKFPVMKSTHFDTNEKSVVPASTKSVEKAAITRTNDNPAVVKISETTGRVRRRRRKSRKKKHRPT